MTPHDLAAMLATLGSVSCHAEKQYRVWAQRAQNAELRIVLLHRVEERVVAAAELKRQLDWLEGVAATVAEPAGAGRAMPLAQRRATPVSTPFPLPTQPLGPPTPITPLQCNGSSPEGRHDDDGDVMLLAECEALEMQAIDAYWHAMQAPLPKRLRLLLQNQYAAVKRSHHRALVMRCLALGRLDAAAAPPATRRQAVPRQPSPALPQPPLTPRPSAHAG